MSLLLAVQVFVTAPEMGWYAQPAGPRPLLKRQAQPTPLVIIEPPPYVQPPWGWLPQRQMRARPPALNLSTVAVFAPAPFITIGWLPQSQRRASPPIRVQYGQLPFSPEASATPVWGWLPTGQQRPRAIPRDALQAFLSYQPNYIPPPSLFETDAERKILLSGPSRYGTHGLNSQNEGQYVVLLDEGNDTTVWIGAAPWLDDGETITAIDLDDYGAIATGEYRNAEAITAIARTSTRLAYVDVTLTTNLGRKRVIRLDLQTIEDLDNIKYNPRLN